MSRDPLGEPAFYAEYVANSKHIEDETPVSAFAEEKLGNLFAFLHNSLANGTDKLGLAGPAIPLMAAFTICAAPQMLKARNDYPDSSDKFKHCWASCRIAKLCGNGMAQVAGMGKEARDAAVAMACKLKPDLWICKGGHGDFNDLVTDLLANQQCIPWETNIGIIGPIVSMVVREDCECCCRRKVGE